MHVSKPPKEGTPSSHFFKDLKTSADRYPTINVDGVHKKINLADELLAWEHERYSIRRLPAFTLSSVKSHRDLSRSTILDTKETLDLDRVVKHTHVIAEALAKQLYNLTNEEVFSKSLVSLVQSCQLSFCEKDVLSNVCLKHLEEFSTSGSWQT